MCDENRTMAEKFLASAPLVDLLAQLLELDLDPEHRPGVIANFERTRAIARLVMEFPIADDVEVAPVFQP
jgi:Protein of unknown function (DUF4089)